MIDDSALQPAESRGGSSFSKRVVLDGIVVGGTEVWLLVAQSTDDILDLLAPGPEDSPGALRICRAIRDGGVVILDKPDPDRDPLLSELIRGERGDAV